MVDPFVERLIGSIRRECLDHLIVLNEASLRRILKSYFRYYERSRTHLSLAKDAPQARPVQPVEMGAVVERPRSADCTIAMNDVQLDEAFFFRLGHRDSSQIRSGATVHSAALAEDALRP